MSVKKIIQTYSELLAERLKEVKLLDAEETKKLTSVFITLALKEASGIQVNEFERKANQLKLILAHSDNYKDKMRCRAELATLNSEKKKYNILNQEIKNIQMEKKLLRWMKEHHSDSLLRFYDFHNKKRK